MSQTYQARRRAQAAPAEKKAQTAAPGPSLSELAAGAMPSQEQMGRRVDLPGAIREKMEASFGADFSGVKVFESPTVADAGAQAMTMGSNIAFAPGQLDLVSTSGQAVLGHELSHVVSQARGESAGQGFLADSGLEAQADRQGMLAAQGESVYTGPVTPVGASTAMAAAGPMQAKKGDTRQAKSAEELTSPDFDELAQYSDRTGGLAYYMSMRPDWERRGMRGKPNDEQYDKGWRTNQFDVNSDVTDDQADVIDQGDKGKLNGHVFRPKGDANGKHVILYSGSGGPAASQVNDQVKLYTEQGYTVHVYDYRGFGESTFGGRRTKPSEWSMMEDATAIYEHVLQNNFGDADAQPISPKDILVHGYSMGGVAASHVARHAAIQASRSGQESDKLGGLVLESSMRNFGNAAVGSGLPKFMEPMLQEYGKRGMGEFDTMANLTEAASLDNSLPLTVVTGTDERGDHLAEENTHLYEDASQLFPQHQMDRDNVGHFYQAKLRDRWYGLARDLMRH